MTITEGQLKFLSREIDKSPFVVFITAVIAVKIIFFIFDPSVMFFADSVNYVRTAIFNFIPPDRSFSYGVLIKILTTFSHSLTSLVFVQVILSSVASILITFILLRFVPIKPFIAYAMGLACALEPIQLLSERYVMTETVSLFIFAIYITIVFTYLEKASYTLLAALQVSGVMLISIRLSFLPLIQLITIVLPFLIIPNICKMKECKLSQLLKLASIKSVLPVLLLHLIVSLGLFHSLHLGYKNLNGYLSKRPPAYQYLSGLFILADWAPVVKAEDFPNAEIANKVLGGVKFSMINPRERRNQRWAEGGLISNIRAHIPDVLEAERVARETALNALKRDPLGVLSLAIVGFREYWDIKYLHRTLLLDRFNLPMRDDMLKLVRENYNIDGERLHLLNTITNVYYINSWPWYLFLLCSPILAIILLFISDNSHKRQLLIVFLSMAFLVAISISLIERPTVRYLHPLSWIIFIVIGLLFNILDKKFTKQIQS